MVIDMGYFTKVLKKMLILIFALIAIYLSFKLAVFYIPFLIGFIISLLIEPLIKLINKKTKLTRKSSAIVVMLCIFSILISLIALGTITLITEASNLLQSLNIYIEKIYNQIQKYIETIKFDNIQIPSQVISMFQTSTNNLLDFASEWISKLLTSIIQRITEIPIIGIYIVITILSTYFICADKLFILDQLEHHFPKIWVKKFRNALEEVNIYSRWIFESRNYINLYIFYGSSYWIICFKTDRFKYWISTFSSTWNWICRCFAYTSDLER